MNDEARIAEAEAAIAKEPPCIAWERRDRPFFERLWRTVVDATMEPVETFERLGPSEDAAPALALAFLCSIIGHSPALILFPCLGLAVISFGAAFIRQTLDMAPTTLVGLCLIVAPLALILLPLIADGVYALVFHAIAKLAGGRGSFAQSLRAMLYTGVLRFWLGLVLLFIWVPMIGGVGQGGARAAIAMWSGACAYGAARGVHGIQGDRALLVGVLTPLFSIGLMAFVVALGVLVFGTVFASSIALHLPWAR